MVVLLAGRGKEGRLGAGGRGGTKAGAAACGPGGTRLVSWLRFYPVCFSRTVLCALFAVSCFLHSCSALRRVHFLCWSRGQRPLFGTKHMTNRTETVRPLRRPENNKNTKRGPSLGISPCPAAATRHGLHDRFHPPPRLSDHRTWCPGRARLHRTVLGAPGPPAAHQDAPKRAPTHMPHEQQSDCYQQHPHGKVLRANRRTARQ